MGPVKQIFLALNCNYYLTHSLNICFGCPKEPSHRDGSFEYPQHMFWLRNKKYNFLLHTLIWGPVRPFLMDFPIHFDTITMGLPIVYFKGSQVEFSKL